MFVLKLCMGFISVCGVSVALLASVSSSNFKAIDHNQQAASGRTIRSQDPTPQAAEYGSEWVKKEEGDYAEFFAQLAVLSTIPVPYHPPVFSLKAQQKDPRYVNRPQSKLRGRR